MPRRRALLISASLACLLLLVALLLVGIGLPGDSSPTDSATPQARNPEPPPKPERTQHDVAERAGGEPRPASETGSASDAESREDEDRPFGRLLGSQASGLEDETKARLAFRRQSIEDHSDPSGELRPDLWRAGVRAAHEIPATPWYSASVSAVQGAVSGNQWKQVGPAPLRIDASPSGIDYNRLFQGAGPDSGQVADIAIDPSGSTDKTIYIATAGGGIWKSTTGGQSWAPKSDNLSSLSIGAVTLDPANPSIVYAGTGDYFDNSFRGFSQGVGVYRSTNGGGSWSLTSGSSALVGKDITRMVMPASGKLLVATTSGLYRSNDGGAHFGDNAPSFDNGNPVFSGFITDLHLDTETPTTVYAAKKGSGIYKSTDSGATFPSAILNFGTATPGYISFTQSTLPNNDTFYANVQFDDGSGLHECCAYVYGSSNGGADWQGSNWQADDLSNELTNRQSGCQCGYDQTIGVDPRDANRLYVGFRQLWLSTDAGGVNIPNAHFGDPSTTEQKVHWDNHAVAFSPLSHSTTTPSRLYIGTDGGIATSSNGGTTWGNINNGIATNLFRGIDIGRGSATANGYTYGAAQDTGTSEHRPSFPGTDWHLGIDGDGGFVAVDPADPKHAFTTDNGSAVETKDAGGHWTFREETTGGLPYGAFRYAWAPNPSNPSNSVVYAGSSDGAFDPGPYLYRSTNAGYSFFFMHTFPAGITWISVAPSDSNTVWVGLDDGTVYRTHDAYSGSSATWDPISVGGAPSKRVTGIAVDPANVDRVAVTYSGFCACPASTQKRHVFLTTNGGSGWNDISKLPDLPTYAVVFDRGTTPSSIIVANDAGVMRTTDSGTTWQRLGLRLPYVQATSLALDGSATPALLRAGTYGRSVLQLTAAPPPSGQRIVFESDRDGDYDIYSMNPDGSDVVNLTNNGVKDEEPVLSPNGKKIAFSTTRDGNYNIYVMNADGTNPTQITANTAVDEFPAWSPNGTQISWDSNRDGDYEIFKVNLDKTGLAQLTSNTTDDFDPAWSPDGTKIAFDSEADGDPDIYTMSTTGTNLTKLTNNATSDYDPAWSPDGTKIAFDSNRDGDYEIYSMPAAGGAASQLTTNSGFADELPAWSPDGKRIAFDSDRDGDFEVYSMPAAGGAATQLTSNAGTDDFHVSWAGSQRIVFESDNDGDYDIYSMNPDGSDLLNLTNNDVADEHPVLSPNGNKIAFSTKRDGNYNIYVMNADGTNPTRITPNTAVDEFPAWSPNGNQLSWDSNRDGDYEIFKVNLDTTGLAQLTQNATDDTEPAWSPDGTKIAFDSNADGDYELYTMSTTGTSLTNLTNNTTSDYDPAWSPDGTKIAFSSNRDGDYEIYSMPAAGGTASQLTTNSTLDEFPAWSPDGRKIAFDSKGDGDKEIYTMPAAGGTVTKLTNNADTDFHPAWGG
jgi:Tol biopolymer transport system component/photosystem II stability/assembly factor-like uncharacterized protein